MDAITVCRTCLCGDSPMKSIYSTITISPNEQSASNDNVTGVAEIPTEVTIHSMIAACIETTAVESDGISTQICEGCCHTLKASFLFKRQCERAFGQLKQLLADRAEKHGAESPKDVGSEPAHEKADATDALPADACQYCGVTISRKAKLKKHIEMMHTKPLRGSRKKEEIQLSHNKHDCDKMPSAADESQNAESHDQSGELSKEHEQLNISVEEPAGGDAFTVVYEEEYLDQSTVDIGAANEANDQLDEESATINVRRPKPKASNKKTKVIKSDSKASATLQTNESVSSDPHQCDVCSKVFTRVTHLKRHKLTHSDERPFVCDICDKRFRRADHLRIHKHHHSAIKPHKCEHCDKGFTRIEHVRRHILARHSDRPPLKKEFICDICKRGFTSFKYLQKHIKAHTERSFDCKFCEMKFNVRADLAEHAKTHANERPYLCSECGLRFVRKDYLVIHMRRHKNIKPYQCKFCSKAFPRATDLTVHERYHTGERAHLCTVCGKGFHRAYNLRVHMRVHSGEKPYKCPRCFKSFSQGNDLKSHVRSHTGERYKCDLCSAGFIQGYHLTQHKRSAHGIDLTSNIRRVAKFLPTAGEDNHQSMATTGGGSIQLSDHKQPVYQVLSADGQHLYSTPHDAVTMQHQIMVPMTIDNGNHTAMHPQQTIVMLQVDNSDIKLEPAPGQTAHGHNVRLQNIPEQPYEEC